MNDRIEFRSMTNVNGEVRPTAEARVPVMDRGFLYGDSIYEVFRTYRGIPLFHDEHWARFENSAALSHVRIGLAKDEMTEQIRRTVQASGAPAAQQDVYVRYIVTRGEGPIDLHPAADLETTFVVIVNELPYLKPEFFTHGLKVAVARTLRNPGASLNPNIKGGNYLNNVLGIIEARRHGADDSLMLNEAGLVTEASNSNVFFVIDGELVTPSQVAANLRGLTKAAVHEVCRAHGLPSHEREIPIDAVLEATEFFFTSSIREVTPVAELRVGEGIERSFPAGGGPVTRRVARLYADYVEDYLATHEDLSLF